MSPDLQMVDDYLEKWDRFAQGENQLAPYLRNNKSAFEAALTLLLQHGDKRATARMVFYAVVQVGGYIPTSSDLGGASAAILGPDFPVMATKEIGSVYFAGDLFFWWEANRHRFEPFALLDDWSQRDFAKTTVIPMYGSWDRK